MDRVLKFNGTWHLFGQLKRPRAYHSSINWNGAVYFIGGRYQINDWLNLWDSDYDYSYHSEVDEDSRVRMEIWKIQDLPDHFETTENWPELFNWKTPHIFIVPDSFFPDH